MTTAVVPIMITITFSTKDKPTSFLWHLKKIAYMTIAIICLSDCSVYSDKSQKFRGQITKPLKAHFKRFSKSQMFLLLHERHNTPDQELARTRRRQQQYEFCHRAVMHVCVHKVQIAGGFN